MGNEKKNQVLRKRKSNKKLMIAQKRICKDIGEMQNEEEKTRKSGSGGGMTI